jgi:hypothetical protein
MDYSDASYHRFHDALDVVYSAGINEQCLHPFSLVLH